MINIKNFIFFFILNIFGFLLMPIFRYFKFFEFAVLVYPGTKKDTSSYIPFASLRKILPDLSIVAFMTNKKDKKRGIIFGTKYYISEIKEKKDIISKKIERYAKFLRVKKVALVGRLPKILFDYNQSLFVSGRMGTVFSVIDSTKAVISKLNLKNKDLIVGIVGVGFIGEKVLDSLKKMDFKSVIAFDTRFDVSPSVLKECDLLIILTPSGDDVKDLIQFFKSNVIILDDTHPYMSKKIIERIKIEKKGVIFKVAVQLEGINIFPKIPGFKNNWIPGCIVETIALLYDKEIICGSQQIFNQKASEIGFRAIFEKSAGKNF